MSPSQILFHHRLFADGSGVDDGLGIGDLFFPGNGGKNAENFEAKEKRGDGFPEKGVIWF